MGDYARPIEVTGTKGTESEARPPTIGSLSGPMVAPNDADQSLGVALGQARAALQGPEEDRSKLSPIGRIRRAGEAVVARASDRLRSVREVAGSMEGDLQRAAGHGLSELKQRALEFFLTHYRPGGIEAEAQQRTFARSKEGFDPLAQSDRWRQSSAGNAPPPLTTEGLTPQAHRIHGLDQQEEQKRQIRREGRSLRD